MKKFYDLRRLRQTPSSSPGPTQTGDFPDINLNNNNRVEQTPTRQGGFQFGVLNPEDEPSQKDSPPLSPAPNTVEIMEWSNEYSLTRRHPEPQRRLSIQARLGAGGPKETPCDTPKARSIHQRLGTRQRLDFEAETWNEPDSQPLVEDDNYVPLASSSRKRSAKESLVERARKERRKRRFASVPSMKLDPILKETPIKPNVEQISEFNVELLGQRAERFSDVPQLKQRAWRFSEEVASELVVVKEAKIKNMRFDRFRDDVESEEEEED